MNKEFQTLRKKQRFGLRKLNIGVASVLLGFTIFGYNLASQAPVAHADTSTVPTASAGSGASGPVESGSSATGVASGSPASNSQAASATSSAATDSQAAPATQVTAPADSQSSESANSGNATSSPASQAGTVSANHTASNTNTTPSSQTVSVNETTSSATQARTLMRTLMTNLAVRYSNTADDLPKSVQHSETDTPLPTTTQTYDKVGQPLLYDYLLHTATGTRDGQTWVDKTVAKGFFGQDYPGYTLDTIFGKTSKPGIILSNPDKYFFAAYVDFSESYHRVILLARSQDPSDKNLYSYTIHTYTQNTSTTTTKPGDSTKEQYTGVAGSGGSKHDLIFHNYGDSFTVKLRDFNDEYGMLPVFDGGLLDPTYGSNTLDQNDTAAKTGPISFWASAIPQETSTKVRYVDQATGKDIVQPMEISGFGYQGFKVNGEAPTVKGYHLVSSPKSLGLPYEDGMIAPYKVGQTYDLALSDSVVIKQTVIHTDGTVRATPYYNGSPLTNASKVLGRESYNDHMSFGTPGGKYYTYTNRIGQVGDSYIYYYAKDSDPNGSEMWLHFIDVTGVNNSNYAPSDGPELDAYLQTKHGNIGDNYSFAYTVPTNYYEVGSSGVTGTYSGTHHDAYVYVKKQAENKLYAPVASDPLTVEQGTTLTADQAKAAVKYNGDVPSDATYAWDPKTPVDTAMVGSYTPNVIVTYGDHTTSSVPVTVNVVAKTDKSNYTVAAGKPVTLTHGQKVKVGDSLDSSAVTLKDAKGQKVSLPDGAKVVWTTEPDTSEVENGKTGQAKVVYGDNSASEPVTVTYNVTQNDADQYTPELITPAVDQNAPVDPTSVVTNQDKLPKGTTYSWTKEPNTETAGQPATGSLHVAYPDGSSEDVPVTVNVKANKDQYQPELITPAVDQNAEVDPNSVVTNKDNLPKGTTYSWTTKPDTSKAGQPATGSLHVAYPDGSSKDVPVTVNVKSNADQYTPAVPDKTKVDDPTKLTNDEKKTIEDKIVEANKDKFPEGTDVTVDNDGTATITYPDKSVDTIPGNKLVEEKTDTPTPTEKTVNVVFKGVDKKYDGKPAEVTVTITDQDGKDVDVTLEAGKDYTITKQSAAKARMLLATAKPLTDAPTEVGTYHVALTEAGKQKLKDAGYTTVNETPADFTISPADTPTPTPDTKTDDEKYDPIIPGDKVKVDDPTKLTDGEKEDVVKAVEDANKDKDGNSTLPDETKITVSDNGDVTVTYPDGSKDTIPGDKVVEGKTDADKTDVTVPGTKVEVGDPTKLTDAEKDQVKTNVERANQNNFPAGTVVTVADDGTATITYPDGSVDQISAADLITKPTAAGQAGKGTGTTTTNGQGAPAGQGKADQAKTLPQTGNEQGSLLAASGLGMLLLGMLGLGGKRKKED